MSQVGKRRTIRGEEYAIVILKVAERDAHGRPRVATIFVDDTEKISIEGGEEFITAFIRVDLLAKTRS